jgi:adhesin transport system outer membrane protein
LSNQIRATWAEMNALSNQLGPVRALLTSTEDVVASYLRQFQVGRRSWLEVLNAQREKFQAYNTLADIENPLEFAKLRLLLQAGQVSADSLHLLNE